MDNIKIEKTWADQTFFEVLITCANKTIIASTSIYLTNDLVDELHDRIEEFLLKKSEVMYWQSKEPKDNSTPCFSLQISNKDLIGHLIIEVYLELNDGGNLSKHHCCFFVNTEIGLLYEFNKKLRNIKNGDIGTVVSLNGNI